MYNDVLHVSKRVWCCIAVRLFYCSSSYSLSWKNIPWQTAKFILVFFLLKIGCIRSALLHTGLLVRDAKHISSMNI
jgi:hypothetical protein